MVVLILIFNWKEKHYFFNWKEMVVLILIFNWKDFFLEFFLIGNKW